MLVAIAGSQGSGKSTVLKQLEDLGFPVITRKTSRSILEDWGVTLGEVNNNHELTRKFQDEIVIRKSKDEFEATHSDKVWFTERTYADLFTYALISLGKDNQHSDWIDQYYLTCAKHNQHYDLVFYLRGGLFQIQSDGVRGANRHYGRLADVSMLDITQQMIHPSRLSIIDTPDITIRSQLIAAHTKHLLIKHIQR